VLVLADDQRERQEAEKPDSAFFSTRDGLTACLDEERYVVYPLSPEDAVRAPWKDNCSLLVVTSGLRPEIFSAGILNEIAGYVKDGGTLLSMNSVTNAAFGFRVPERFLRAAFVAVTQLSSGAGDGEGEVPTPDEYVVVQKCKSVEPLPDAFPALQEKLPKVLAKMKMTANGTERENGEEQDVGDIGGAATAVDCIQHVRFEDSSGQAVLSHVDLLRPAGSSEASISELVALKRDAASVEQMLRTVLQEVGMDCSKRESSSPTPSYLICSDQLRVRFEATVAPLVKDDVIKGSEVDIELVRTDEDSEGSSVDPPPSPAVDKVVLLTRPSERQLKSLEFDTSQYMKYLRTGHMGRTLLYTPVIGSTQTMLTGNMPFSLALKTDMGVVCAAGQQTRGRGRQGNVWLSPKGCMMFSATLTVQPSSRLHGRLPLLQHIVALSVVSAIRTIPGYEELPVCVKWPNDIYYQDQVKLGGILVTTFSGGGTSDPTTAIIGCGVNVSNKYPTMSVNDCIQLHNTAVGGTPLPPLTVEALLALTLNRLERYLSLYEHTGMAAVETEYYHYWLHRYIYKLYYNYRAYTVDVF
jgi:biotin--protein ligase